MHLLAYFNLSTGKLSSTLGGSSITLPQLAQGDSLKIGLRLSEQIDGASFEVAKNVLDVRASIGFIDQRPTAGSFVLRVGSGPYVAGTNQTAPIAHSASPVEVARSVQALGLTSVTVTALNGSWIISNEGNILDLSGASSALSGDELSPLSFVHVRELLREGEYSYEVRLIQSPLASTSSFAALVPPQPSIVRVQEGGTEATTEWPEIQAIKINPTFRGTYQLRRGYKKTGELSVDDGPDEIAEALALIADDGGIFTVTNPLENVAHVTFGGTMSGLPQELIEVEVFSAPPGDPTFVLSLNTIEAAAALRLADSIKPFLEVEVTTEDDDLGGNPAISTSQRVAVTLVRDLNWAGLEVAANIDWLRPPYGESYVPFRLDQIITGTQNYVTTLGDGVATVFVVDHNLNTLDLLPPALRDNTTGAFLSHGTDWVINASDLNSITIAVNGDVPTLYGLMLVIGAAGPRAAFQAHTHTIEQVDGLSAILDDLGTRVTDLEALVPTITPSVSAGLSGTMASWELPEIFEIFPTRTAITEKKVSSIDKTKLPRKGGLLPAVYTVAAPTVADTLPGSPVKGIVYQFTVADSELVLPGYLGRPSSKIETDAFYTWDGRGFYAVEKVVAGDNVYYPVDFNRELFRLHVGEKQLLLTKVFSLDFTFVAAVFNSNVSVQWGIVIDIGIPTQQGTASRNLLEVTFLPPSLDQPFILTEVPSAHTFGLRISRSMVDAVDTLKVNRVLYGQLETSDTVITSNNFVVRGRLVRFDTSNGETDPRGLIAFEGLASSSDADTAAEIGTATIK